MLPSRLVTNHRVSLSPHVHIDIMLDLVMCTTLIFDKGEEKIAYKLSRKVQWLSGRVLDLRPRDRGFEPHRRCCLVVLEQDTFILA